MPVILSRAEEEVWLDKQITTVKLLKSLLKSAPENQMRVEEVSTQVNAVINDNENLIKSV
jgi:putative SOS response-associated peptidase YedK